MLISSSLYILSIIFSRYLPSMCFEINSVGALAGIFHLWINNGRTATDGKFVLEKMIGTPMSDYYEVVTAVAAATIMSVITRSRRHVGHAVRVYISRNTNVAAALPVNLKIFFSYNEPCTYSNHVCGILFNTRNIMTKSFYSILFTIVLDR